MARQDYVPQEEGALAQWADNLAIEANNSANATAMGWGSSASAVSNAANAISEAVSAKEAARQSYLAAVAAQDATIADSLGIIRPMVAAGKKEATATAAVQQSLGVVGPTINFDPSTYKADLRSVTAVGSATLEIKFFKARGCLSAANLYVRKQGATTWTLAGTMVRSPFIYHVNLTTPGAPECYEVRIRGIVGNDEIGQFSDISTVLVN